MKRFYTWLPNTLTMGNLFCGFLAILFLTRVHEILPLADKHDYYALAMWMMLLAGIFDFFDGFVARKLGVSSEVGRELDSLSDVVSFGIAPALLIYQRALTDIHWVGVVAVAIYVCCGAGRLARHNVLASDGRKPYFTGMPIEGGTALLIAVVLSSPHIIKETTMVAVALVSVVIAGLLMISTIRFTAEIPPVVRIGALAIMGIAFAFPGIWTLCIPWIYIAYAVTAHQMGKKRHCPASLLDLPSLDTPASDEQPKIAMID